MASLHPEWEALARASRLVHRVTDPGYQPERAVGFWGQGSGNFRSESCRKALMNSHAQTVDQAGHDPWKTEGSGEDHR